MRESQIHQAFSKWLDSHKIPYVHARTDRKTSMICGDPDYYVMWQGRVVAVEVKVPGGKLSDKQRERIAYLRAAGNSVTVAYSLSECIAAVCDAFDIPDPLPERFTGLDGYSEEEKAEARAIAPNLMSLAETASEPLFIGTIGGKPWVCRGSGVAGTEFELVRSASAFDLMTLKSPCGGGAPT